jgi:hypothetical protein
MWDMHLLQTSSTQFVPVWPGELALVEARGLTGT